MGHSRSFAILFSLLLGIAAHTPATLACDLTLLTDARPVSFMNVVVVGGYSSGADLAPVLRSKGIQNIIHVHPADEIPAALKPSFNAKNYNRDIIFNGDLKALVAELSKQGRIDAVFAGTETAVDLTDLLNRELGLKGNDPRLSEFHRNKPKMQQRISEKGLDSIAGLETGSIDEALEWVKARNGGRYPVVVKPVDGAGTQGFNLCFNEAQVREAFAALLGTRNVLNLNVDRVLVQRYVNSEEYVVNTVTKDGKHVVSEIWHYHKIKVQRPDGKYSKIYDYDELLAFDSPEAQKLVPYAFKTLDALGIEQGPGHLEIMLPDEGPVLMEMGARLMGGHTFTATREAIGTSALDLMIQAQLFPSRFDQVARDGLTRKKYVRNVQMIARKSGTITRVNYSAEQIAKALPTFAGISAAGVGDKLEPTVDLITSPGSMWLIGDSEEALERDYQLFRNSIEPNLYDVR